MLTGESVPQMKVSSRHRLQQIDSRPLDIDIDFVSLCYCERNSFISELL